MSDRIPCAVEPQRALSDELRLDARRIVTNGVVEQHRALAGHTVIGTTLNLYTHVLPATQRDAADRMDDVLRKEGHGR